MRQLYLIVILLFTCLFSTHYTKAQHIDSFSAYGYCKQVGDTPAANYNLVINPLPSGTTVKIYYGDGNSKTITPTSGFLWDSHDYTSEGTYTVKAVTYNGTTPVDSMIKTLRIYCSAANIKIFHDINSDCMRQVTEKIHGSESKIEIKENGIVVDTLSCWGYGYYPIKQSTAYIFRLFSTPVGTSATCPSTGQISFTTPSFKTTQNLDFGLQCGTTSSYDLFANVYGQFRPVSSSYIHIYARNNELCSSQSGVLTLNISPKYTYSSATVTPTSISGNTITWNLTAAQLYLYAYISVTVTPATTVSLGDTICNTVSIAPTSGDINITNNTAYTCNTVRASLDPNEKTVYPEGNFKPGDIFTYRIDFENLGDDTAFNVHILDTLSMYLNENNIEILNTSHPMSYTILTAGSQKILKFDYPNIMLADSNNKQHNKGFVIFKIGTKIGMPPGYTLSNRAGIYFDINPVVMTNSADRKLAPVNVSAIENVEEILVYPNPANDILNINMSDSYYQHATILNTVGQELKQTTVNKGNNTINIKQLTPGIYQLLLKGEKGTKAIKFEKL